MAPDNLQNNLKSLSRPLTVKKGYNHVIQTSGYLEGQCQWELTSKLPPEVAGVILVNSSNKSYLSERGFRIHIYIVHGQGTADAPNYESSIAQPTQITA